MSRWNRRPSLGWVICQSCLLSAGIALVFMALLLLVREPTLRLLLGIPAGLLALGAAWAVAKWTARSIDRSVRRIDFRNPEQEDVFLELLPIVRGMEHLALEHEQQDRFRREFTANVSHELKTPLTSISGFAEIIRDGMVRQEDIPRFAGNIHKEARRLITLVGDIIKITQMDDKQVPVQREMLDLRQLCGDVLELLEPAADAIGVRCYLEGEADLPRINGAKLIADEMIYNLCDNAIKYNVSGGVVRVRLEARGPEAVAVTVEDTGIGIPPEHQNRVFERFYRVDKNRSKERGGTGLGLSIVKHGALYHGASLELKSQPGVGTGITVVFPVHPPEN